MEQIVEFDYKGSKLILKAGKIAKQANGSIMAQYGDTVVFASAVMGKAPAEDPGFFPLSVHYIEKFYAAGRIPGGFIKREGKPSDLGVLTSRIIDRSLRPLFPEGFRNEVQIVPMTLAFDGQNSPDTLGLIASSAALAVSDIPFKNPVGAVRVCYKDGLYIVNPTIDIIKESLLNVVVAGTSEGITMVEGSADRVSEGEMVGAIEEGYKVVQDIIRIQKELVEKVGKPKVQVSLFTRPEEIDAEVRDTFGEKLKNALDVPGKLEKYSAIESVFDETATYFAEKYPEDSAKVKFAKGAIHDLEYNLVREKLFSENLRVDGRKPEEIRPLESEVSVLPMVHGSSLFTRGETQALGVLTLGASSDGQRVDALMGEDLKRYMLHYNFPSFSVGEAGRVGPPGRREIGHGYLAEKALEAIIPDEKDFPYTIRLVSEIMESNGSSSQATICACCLALMDGGVPIKAPVSGIAMGLMFNKEKTDYKILSDIQGMEDHYGDMDFKVAGTGDGITAFQLDIKMDAISVSILSEALEEAKKARLIILENMVGALEGPREEISQYAPKLSIIQADPDNIRYLIGPGGKTIKKIVEETGAKIDIEDNGEIKIVAPNSESANLAYEKIYALVRDVKQGDIISNAIVKKIADFGAFIELAPGREGLCHISNIADRRIRNVRDVLEVGELVKVKVLNIDPSGKIDLSIKDVK